jgi:hypothetical protein
MTVATMREAFLSFAKKIDLLALRNAREDAYSDRNRREVSRDCEIRARERFSLMDGLVAELRLACPLKRVEARSVLKPARSWKNVPGKQR